MHQSVHCHARESRKGTPESRTRVFRLQCCNVRLSGTSAPSNKETEPGGTLRGRLTLPGSSCFRKPHSGLGAVLGMVVFRQVWVPHTPPARFISRIHINEVWALCSGAQGALWGPGMAWVLCWGPGGQLPSCSPRSPICWPIVGCPPDGTW
jgi:hypothetical protein